MAKVPTPYKRGVEDVPVLLCKFTTGSNNATRATVRLYKYADGTFCLQIEDRLGGAEMWLRLEQFQSLMEILEVIALAEE